MSGIVVSLHCAPHSHAPMIALPVAHLVPGKGIEGDRYFLHPKRLQPGTKTPYEVTLVEQEALEALAAVQPETVTEASGRRNIVVRSCSLPTLADHLFRIGEVLLCGAALRDAPCDSPDHGQHSVCGGLHHQWLGASILTEGVIAPGDPLNSFPSHLKRSNENQACCGRSDPPLIQGGRLPFFLARCECSAISGALLRHEDDLIPDVYGSLRQDGGA